MRRWISLAVALLLFISLASAPSAAQIPKIGDEYVDATDLGFRIKMPADWSFIPPQPGEVNNIGRYAGGGMAILRNPKNGQPFVEMDVTLLKFDRRKKADDAAPADDGKPKIIRFGRENFDEWTKSLSGGWMELPKLRKQLEINKVACTRRQFTCEYDKQEQISANMLAFEFKLTPDLEVVMVGVGSADDKKWSKWEGCFESMAKSFKRVEINASKVAVATSSALRDQKRAKLQEQVAKNPGWKLYETPNFFVISAKNDDKQFIDELLERLERIRERYEELYKTPENIALRKVKRARDAAEAAKKKKDGDKPKEGEEPKEGEGEKPDLSDVTVAASDDSEERSRCSVVRVCLDDTQSRQYGGPGGSAGYWSWVDEELVIYDDQKEGGRKNTWATLNHEAFHQYIFYFFGQLSPHSWYNEGSGDFFAGYQLEHKKFQLKPFDWRFRLIQGACKGDVGVDFAPLKELVRWTQAEYYGNNKYKLGGGENYAQGWSFIYFLRTGKQKCRSWNAAWDTILDVYLKTLIETDDLDAAVDKAFAGVDWDVLEATWRDFVINLKS
jgi:hypothetical protein